MRIIPLIFLVVLLSTCGKKRHDIRNNEESVIVIDLLSEPESTVTRLSDIATDIEYISLETNQSSLLGSIRQEIISTDSKFYIKSIIGALNSCIFCFDRQGRFLFKLENQGRGPQEYTNIEDFDIGSDNKNLILLSSLESKLYLYRISEADFTFQGSVSFKDPKPYRVGIIQGTDRIFLAIPPWLGTEPTLSLLINTLGDTILFKTNCYKYEMVRNSYARASNEMLVYSVGNTLCFKEVYSDTVFYVDAKDNSFRPRIIFDTHGTNMTPEMRGGAETPKSYTTAIGYLFETSRYAFYWYFKSDILNGIIFDKKTRIQYRSQKLYRGSDLIEQQKKDALKDDLAGGPDFNLEFINKFYCSNGKLFAFVEAMTLKNYVAGEEFKKAIVKYPEKKEELRKLADSLKETDNPVLVMVTPKE
jgi:hypothetical protein